MRNLKEMKRKHPILRNRDYVVGKGAVALDFSIELPSKAPQVLLESLIDRVCKLQVFVRRKRDVESVHMLL